MGPSVFHRDKKFEKKVLDHYGFNLSRMVVIARSVGAEIIFATPASNLRDRSPFKSERRRGLSLEDKNGSRDLFDSANTAHDVGDRESALERIREAAEINDEQAEESDFEALADRLLGRLAEYREASNKQKTGR